MSDAAESRHAAIHRALLAYLRSHAAAHGAKLAAKFATLPDAALVRMMFANVRGRERVHGLRLTKFGLAIMERHFLGCEVALPADEKWCPADLLYLDSTAMMPYYCGDSRCVLYDHLLGIKLKLASGRIGILIDIEGCR